uniref:Cytochrome b6-f complex subunit 7 n=1 Tax=Flintiella sanguinaria TaxID=101926 RepID=A0A1X9PUB6_9RHOD|nr:cytochrome b6f complex subunit 7 [Flintiella sanguinaria]
MMAEIVNGALITFGMTLIGLALGFLFLRVQGD